MKIGLDIHGCIDAYPVTFCRLSDIWVTQGHDVYIITGQEWQSSKPTVDKAGIRYTHHFSIIDHHKEIGTPMYTRSDRDGWWMDGEKWMRSKGEYAKEVGIDIHFDDCIEYAKYFPSNCTYVIVPESNFKFDFACFRT